MTGAGTIVRQALHSGAFYVLQMASRLLIAVALGKTLSSADYGAYSLIGAVVGLGLSVVPLGAFQYYSREVPGRPHVEGAALFKSVVVFQTIVMTLVVLVLAGPPPIRHAVSRLLHLPDPDRLLLVAVAVLLVESVTVELTRYLYARREIEKGNVVSFIQTGLWPLAVFAVFALARSAVTLELVLGAWLAGVMAAMIFGLWRADARELWRAPTRLPVYLAAVAFGAPLILSNVLAIVNWAGRFIVAGYHSADVVGIFTYNYNVVLMITALSAPLISNAIQPHITAAYNTGDLGRSRTLLTFELRYRLMLILPLMIVAVVWEREIIRVLARREFSIGGLLAFLAPLPPLITIASTFERVLFLARRTTVIARCYVAAGGIQLVLYVVLTPLHPYFGPALAMDAGAAALTWLLWRAARRTDIIVSVAWPGLVVPTAIGVVLAVLLHQGLPPLPPVWGLALATPLVAAGFLGLLCLCGGVSSGERAMGASLMREAARRMRWRLGGSA